MKIDHKEFSVGAYYNFSIELLMPLYMVFGLQYTIRAINYQLIDGPSYCSWLDNCMADL